MRSLLVAAAAAIALAACGTANPNVAATVNGVDIPVDVVEAFVASQYADSELGRPGPDDADEAAEFQRQVLSQLIADEIIAEAATRDLGVVVTDELVEEQWEALAEQFGGETPLLEEVERRGLTEAEVRRQLASFVREQLLQEHFIEAAGVTDEEVAEAYEQRRDQQYQVARAAHILVEAEAEADALMAELDAGADFAALAEEHSIDEGSALRGGDLGEAPRGAYVPEFDEALWGGEEGEIVGPVQSQFGYHIIRIDEFRTTPLEEVETQLREELAGRSAQDAFEAWVAGAFETAEVEVNSRFGAWDPVLGQVVAADEVGRAPAQPVDELPLDDIPHDE